jgi:hypothetical protein
MPRTLVVNYHFEDYDVLITRRTIFGNNNPITFHRTRQEAIDRHFEDMARRLLADPSFHEAILSLEGKRLGCVCKPMDCHGDLYVQYIETCRLLESQQAGISRNALINAAIASMRSARKNNRRTN